MSFWDNNKDSFKAAGVATAKGIGRGTKAVSKAGYRTYKNHKGGQPTEGEENHVVHDVTLPPKPTKDQLATFQAPPRRNVPAFQPPHRGETSQYTALVAQHQANLAQQPQLESQAPPQFYSQPMAQGQPQEQVLFSAQPQTVEIPPPQQPPVYPLTDQLGYLVSTPPAVPGRPLPAIPPVATPHVSTDGTQPAATATPNPGFMQNAQLNVNHLANVGKAALLLGQYAPQQQHQPSSAGPQSTPAGPQPSFSQNLNTAATGLLLMAALLQQFNLVMPQQPQQDQQQSFQQQQPQQPSANQQPLSTPTNPAQPSTGYGTLPLPVRPTAEATTVVPTNEHGGQIQPQTGNSYLPQTNEQPNVSHQPGYDIPLPAYGAQLPVYAPQQSIGSQNSVPQSFGAQPRPIPSAPTSLNQVPSNATAPPEVNPKKPLPDPTSFAPPPVRRDRGTQNNQKETTNVPSSPGPIIALGQGQAQGQGTPPALPSRTLTTQINDQPAVTNIPPVVSHTADSTENAPVKKLFDPMAFPPPPKRVSALTTPEPVDKPQSDKDTSTSNSVPPPKPSKKPPPSKPLKSHSKSPEPIQRLEDPKVNITPPPNYTDEIASTFTNGKGLKHTLPPEKPQVSPSDAPKPFAALKPVKPIASKPKIIEVDTDTSVLQAPNVKHLTPQPAKPLKPVPSEPTKTLPKDQPSNLSFMDQLNLVLSPGNKSKPSPPVDSMSMPSKPQKPESIDAPPKPLKPPKKPEPPVLEPATQKDKNSVARQSPNPPPPPRSRNSPQAPLSPATTSNSNSNSTHVPPPPPPRNYNRAKAALPPPKKSGPPELDLELTTGWFTNLQSPLPKSLQGLNNSTSYLYLLVGGTTKHVRTITVRLFDLGIVAYKFEWSDNNVAGVVVQIEKYIPSPIDTKIPTKQELVSYQQIYGEHVAAWSEQQMGKQVGRGECWDLAQHALEKGCGKHAFISTYTHHGFPIIEIEATPTGGLKYLRSQLDEVKRGDILQFKTCVFEDKTTGVTTTAGAPDHTSVVTATFNGKINVVHQNVGGVRTVMTGSYTLANLVKGTVTVYRPVPSEWAGSF